MDRWLVVNPERKTRIVLALFFFLLILYSSIGLQGQGRTANWIFGDGYHIKYTDGEPEVLPFVPGFIAYEGASCISDRDGNLLFYSNTIRVWNADYQPLYNSDTLPALAKPPSSSKTNGSLFLPWPGDTMDQYFAFFQMNDADNRLYCSKIDRELDGGFGGVEEEFKNIPVWEHNICEQLTAVRHGNGRDWWILARKGYSISTEVCLSLLTPEGFISQPAVPANFTGAYTGEMVASPEGDRIAIAANEGVCFPAPPIIALYTFDRCTGALQFDDTLLTRACHMNCYGLSFSKDGSKLYYSTDGKISLYQIDVEQTSLSDSLIFQLSGSSFFLLSTAQLELNSSGEILLTYLRPSLSIGIDGLTNHLAVVRNPDSLGRSCSLDTFGIYLNGRESLTASLPNFANYDLGPLVGSPCDTLSPPDTTQTAIPVFTNPSPTFAVFPSVSDGVFHVTSSISGTIRIMDLYGRAWLEEQISERMSFDLQHAPAGVYIVCLYSERGQFLESRKVVLQD